MQDRPVCFDCDKEIETNAEMVFEAPCGHDHHSSAVFHAICLFAWRERRDRAVAWFAEMRERWFNEHREHQERGDS